MTRLSHVVRNTYRLNWLYALRTVSQSRCFPFPQCTCTIVRVAYIYWGLSVLRSFWIWLWSCTRCASPISDPHKAIAKMPEVGFSYSLFPELSHPESKALFVTFISFAPTLINNPKEFWRSYSRAPKFICFLIQNAHRPVYHCRHPPLPAIPICCIRWSDWARQEGHSLSRLEILSVLETMLDAHFEVSRRSQLFLGLCIWTNISTKLLLKCIGN